MAFYLWVDICEVKILKHRLEGSMSNYFWWLPLGWGKGERVRSFESICYVSYLFLRHMSGAIRLNKASALRIKMLIFVNNMW